MQRLDNFVLPTHFRGRSAIVVQLWWLVQSTIFRHSPQFLYGWRRWLLRCFGAQIGCKVLVRPTTTITYPWKVRIGDYSWIGDDVTLYSLGDITIGEHVVVSQKSYLCAGTHDPSSNNFAILAKPILIQNHVWIATDVFVAPGITINTGSLIGARSTVLNDLPPEMICVGYPCKPLKKRVFDGMKA